MYNHNLKLVIIDLYVNPGAKFLSGFLKEPFDKLIVHQVRLTIFSDGFQIIELKDSFQIDS